MPVSQTTTHRPGAPDGRSPVPVPVPTPAGWNPAAAAYDRQLSLPDLEDAERADALAARAMVTLRGGGTTEAAEDARLAIWWAERSGRSRARSRAEEVLALVGLQEGDGAAAMHHARAAVAGAPPVGRSTGGPAVSTHLTLAVAELLHGAPTASAVAHRAWLDRFTDVGGAPAAHPLGALGACALLLAGDLPEAHRALATVDGAATSSRQVLARAVEHQLRQLRGEIVAAEQLHAVVRQAFSLARAGVPGADLVVWLAATSLEAGGDPAGAADWLAEAGELAARPPVTAAFAPDLVRLNRRARPDLAARVAAASSRRMGGGLDRAHASAALGHLRGEGSLLLDAATHYAHAGWHLAALRARGHAGALLEAADDGAGGSHGRPPARRRSTSVGPEALTSAERRVARLVAEGLTNRQIADRLYVSHRTVDSHVASTLAKLTLTSRVQLAALVATGVVR